ncbi:MAG: TPM domain-containing protein [Cyclobacteriaceae bacterium]|nr:TPM domain-containing protein [Cyclobacteriaceae bacterium]UYN86955.1 MAG: TPM domain-containing protein [Cyclobacteriaceae bacterium]
MSLRKTFTDAELERIKAAVRQAEANISGEIVPVMVSKSGYYTIANYKGSLWVSFLVFAFIVIFDRFVPSLAVYDPLLIFLLVLLAGVVGGVAPNFSDDLRRMLVTQRHMDHATRQRAENAFLEQEVFNTRHRTGIMIFISFFEHEVIIMGDQGISKVVEQKIWDKLVQDLTAYIRKGKTVEGLETTIKRCGEILLEKGFKKTADDVNELRDDVRLD